MEILHQYLHKPNSNQKIYALPLTRTLVLQYDFQGKTITVEKM